MEGLSLGGHVNEVPKGSWNPHTPSNLHSWLSSEVLLTQLFLGLTELEENPGFLITPHWGRLMHTTDHSPEICLD